MEVLHVKFQTHAPFDQVKTSLHKRKPTIRDQIVKDYWWGKFYDWNVVIPVWIALNIMNINTFRFVEEEDTWGYCIKLKKVEQKEITVKLSDELHLS